MNTMPMLKIIRLTEVVATFMLLFLRVRSITFQNI